jgi:hypothetical protein
MKNEEFQRTKEILNRIDSQTAKQAYRYYVKEDELTAYNIAKEHNLVNELMDFMNLKVNI